MVTSLFIPILSMREVEQRGDTWTTSAIKIAASVRSRSCYRGEMQLWILLTHRFSFLIVGCPNNQSVANMFA